MAVEGNGAPTVRRQGQRPPVRCNGGGGSGRGGGGGGGRGGGQTRGQKAGEVGERDGERGEGGRAPGVTPPKGKDAAVFEHSGSCRSSRQRGRHERPRTGVRMIFAQIKIVHFDRCIVHFSGANTPAQGRTAHHMRA